jgi:hypothetical protein
VEASRGEMPKKLWIKIAYFIEESALSRINFSRFVPIGVVEDFQIPAIAGNLRNFIPALTKFIPENFRIVDSSGKPASDAHNRQRFAFEGFLAFAIHSPAF